MGDFHDKIVSSSFAYLAWAWMQIRNYLRMQTIAQLNALHSHKHTQKREIYWCRHKCLWTSAKCMNKKSIFTRFKDDLRAPTASECVNESVKWWMCERWCVNTGKIEILKLNCIIKKLRVRENAFHSHTNAFGHSFC